MTQRVVVTGYGAVSPLGDGADVNWERLVAGRSGLRVLPDRFVSDVPCKVGAPVPDVSEDDEGGFDPDRIMDSRERRKADRFILFALAATEEALRQAGWFPETESERKETATIIASGIGGFPAIVEAVRTTDAKGTRRLSPFVIPSFLANLAAGQVSIRYGFRGPIGAPVTACAASVQAIGDAARMIRAGEVNVAVCGGTEACIDRVSLGGFAAARALSTRCNDFPQAASCPFDSDRDGFVMGEGAGVLVVEEYEHAVARGAPVLAEIVGYGTSSDAHHITAGPEDGAGARAAMDAALRQARLSPGDVQHLNAHATSTPMGDGGEIVAIADLFGRNGKLAVSGTKGATGHLLGAAGGLEAIFAIKSLKDQIAPPTLNLENPDEAAAGIDIVGPAARPVHIEHVISNGFGFGGVNASIVFRTPS